MMKMTQTQEYFRGSMERGRDLLNDKKSKLPIITIILVAMNCFIFLIMLFFPTRWYEYGASGLYHIIENKEYYRLMTAIFIHGDINHLFNNMLILYCAGEVVELSIGRLRFIVIYLFTGIGANVISCGWEWITNQFFNSVGASGSIFGIIGVLLYLVLFHKGKTKQISKQRMILMVIFSLYSGFAMENVNNIAHISGLLIGFFISVLVGKWKY